MREDTLLVVIDTPASGAGTLRAQCVRCRLSWAFPLEDAPYPTEWQASDEQLPPISADEVIDLHRLLSAHEGPLVDLLRTAR
jgi:hypothetical protein